MQPIPMNRRLLVACWAGAMLAAVAAAPAVAQQPDKVRSALSTEKRTHREAAQSQARIDKLDDQTRDMLLEYRATIRETESLRRYNDLLERQIASQVEEIRAIESELARIEETNREVLPMMLRMVDTLEQFVALDLPFLPEERSRRIETLKEIMERADVTTSEKYRRILEAYKVELDYGRTIEAYEGEVDDNGTTRKVDFLRVGRVALLYQTKDGKHTAVFNPETRQWERADDYNEFVKRGLRIARKQAAPELMIMPISAPQEVQ